MTRSARSLLFAFTAAAALVWTGCPGGDVCGDGKKTGKEQCDDGNTADGDGCRTDCTLPASCGNGVIEAGETCDDGNVIPGDGCEADCTVNGAFCGNNVKEASEACDDGNAVGGDGCEPNCTLTNPGCGDGLREAAEQCDDGNAVAGDGCENNCTVTPKGTCGDNKKEWPEACDDGNAVAGDGCENDCTVTGGKQITCPGAVLPAPADGTCSVTAGDASKLFTGVILTPGAIYQGGQVLVDPNGVIQCVGCDCTAGAAAATQIVCPHGVISPGLINPHDHITYQSPPFVPSVPTDGGSVERYEHRHDWRRGNNGHNDIPSGNTALQANIRWAELRQVMAGTTSIAGSGGQKGFLRNLDNRSAPQPDGGPAASQENLGASTLGLNFETFPLGDSAAGERVGDCNYPSIANATAAIPADAAYLPHIAEGIEASARNEFVCLSPMATGKGKNHLSYRTAIIHGIGLKASDISLMVNEGTSLVWSPRSNLSLYGDTAAVAAYRQMNANIALGTDWVISGSMNLLRELKCADYLNASFYNKPFSDDGLWRMVTSNAALATAVDAKVGVLAKGKVADLAIFRQNANTPYRAVIAANPEDVVLTVRGGKVLYGDKALVKGLVPAAEVCDDLDVCGTMKGVCVQSELGNSLDALTAANAGIYKLFYCGGPPQNEPTCTPSRGAPWLVNGSTSYSGVSSSTDTDADGIPDEKDNCPRVFNPIRPMDDGKQADLDGDGKGDVCDICPLGPGTACTRATATDFDADGVANATDNCPGDYNPDQKDTDGDQKGNACDFCPTANAGTDPCGTNVYEVKLAGSKLLNQQVKLENMLVTGVSSAGFFAQVHPMDAAFKGADRSGIYVFASGTPVKLNDRVNLVGTPVDYFGQIQLSSVTATVVSSNNAPPTPVLVNAADVSDTGSRAKDLEGVLVQLANVTVANINPVAGGGDRAPINEFEVEGGLRVNDLFFLLEPFAETGEQLVSLKGVLELRNSHYKVEPRSLADFAFANTSLVSFAPAETFARVGYTGSTFPKALTVKLKRPVASDTTVTVSSSSPADLEVAGGGNLVIPAGAVSLAPNVTGLNVSQGVTVTATLGGTSLVSSVRVLGTTETGKLVSITPNATFASAGSKTTLTVNLDLPTMADTSVALTLTPPTGFGSVPAMVTVAAGQLSASFDVTVIAGASGEATVTALLGTDMATSKVTLTATASHVVISELSIGDAADEFVELYNPTTSVVDVRGWQLQYRANGATSTFQNNGSAFPVNTTIGPRGYLLLGTSAFASNAAYKVRPDLTCSGGFAGVSGLIRVLLPDAGTLDAVGYGPMADGGVSGMSADGGRDGTENARFIGTVPATGSLERKANLASTAATMQDGGDVLGGNGYDSDDNSLDFVIRTVRDPQNRDGGTEP